MSLVMANAGTKIGGVRGGKRKKKNKFRGIFRIHTLFQTHSF